MKQRLLLLILIPAICAVVHAREIMNLAGEWQWRTNPFAKEEAVMLPGSMGTNGKGTASNNLIETQLLPRKTTYSGPAWYSRDIEIPKHWKETDICLLLERTRPSTVYVDGMRIASCRLLSTPHRYNLSEALTPGKHRITVMVDNGDSIPQQIRTLSRACSESTQTNWNGILGRIELVSAPKTHIRRLDVYPDPDERSFKVIATLSRPFDRSKDTIKFISRHRKATAILHRGDTVATAIINLGKSAPLWSENSPRRLLVKAIMPGVDTLQCYAALRKYNIKGNHLAVNDTTTFLRGRNDACVFPLTGFAPMDVASWRDYFRKIKDYGLNYVHFDSWCPPEACFEAADIEGVYLQPELSGKYMAEDSTTLSFLYDDVMAMQREYSGHPSFIMSAGLPDTIYTPGPYYIFPHLDDIEKYTGVVEPRNLMKLKRILADVNLATQADDFLRASGKWAIEQYKAAMETCYRTPSAAGFLLNGIQDYPASDSAFAGILDAFMDSKGLVTPEEWRRSCNRLLVMAELPQRTFTEGDTLHFTLSAANYSNLSLDGKNLKWTLIDTDNTEIAYGIAPISDSIGYQTAGEVSVLIPEKNKPRKLCLNVELSDTDIDNSYSIWAYPKPVKSKKKDKNKKKHGIIVTVEYDRAIEALQDGKRVLFAPPQALVDSVTAVSTSILCDPSHPALAEFPNDGFSDWQWNSILNASYPLILDRLNYMDYRPTVQAIDNFGRNHRLGLVMEFNLGRGRLLMLMADINALEKVPEGRQLIASLSDYLAGSDTFATRISINALKALLTIPDKKAEADMASTVSDK